MLTKLNLQRSSQRLISKRKLKWLRCSRCSSLTLFRATSKSWLLLYSKMQPKCQNSCTSSVNSAWSTKTWSIASLSIRIKLAVHKCSCLSSLKWCLTFLTSQIKASTSEKRSRRSRENRGLQVSVCLSDARRSLWSLMPNSDTSLLMSWRAICMLSS